MSDYICVIAKNGAKKYYRDGKPIAAKNIPKAELPRIVCTGKKGALVSESVERLEKTAARKKSNLEKQQEKRLEKKEKELEKKLEKKSEELLASPEKKRVTAKLKFASKEKSRSKETEGRVAPKALKGARKEATGCDRPFDYDFLRYFWDVADLDDEVVAEYIREYEKRGKKYPYEDRNEWLAV